MTMKCSTNTTRLPGSASATCVGTGWQREYQTYEKNRSIGRIDITVAWVIAMAAAMAKDAEKPDLSEALENPGFSL